MIAIFYAVVCRCFDQNDFLRTLTVKIEFSLKQELYSVRYLSIDFFFFFFVL